MLPFLIGLVLLFPVHEALHGVGFHAFARVARRDIRFGVLWRALMPYCHCTTPIPIVAYRRMLMLPLWVTGGASVAALLVFPTDALAVLAAIAVGACIGDLWIVAKLKPFADDSRILDCPSEIGCDVLSVPPIGTP
jgi:hypothetical protein